MLFAGEPERREVMCVRVCAVEPWGGKGVLSRGDNRDGGVGMR